MPANGELARYAPFLAVLLVAVGSVHAQAEDAAGDGKFYLPEGLEAQVWARSPMFYNPTNIDIDIHGRVWVAEAVNYRLFNNERRKPLIHPKGDRIMGLTDTDGC